MLRILSDYGHVKINIDSGEDENIPIEMANMMSAIRAFCELLARKNEIYANVFREQITETANNGSLFNSECDEEK